MDYLLGIRMDVLTALLSFLFFIFYFFCIIPKSHQLSITLCLEDLVCLFQNLYKRTAHDLLISKFLYQIADLRLPNYFLYDLSLYSTATQNYWRWVLLHYLTQRYQHVGIFCVKPIFHWKTGPNANVIDTKKSEMYMATPKFCIGTQRNLYSTGLPLGFTSGKT